MIIRGTPKNTTDFIEVKSKYLYLFLLKLNIQPLYFDGKSYYYKKYNMRDGTCRETALNPSLSIYTI